MDLLDHVFYGKPLLFFSKTGVKDHLEAEAAQQRNETRDPRALQGRSCCLLELLLNLFVNDTQANLPSLWQRGVFVLRGIVCRKNRPADRDSRWLTDEPSVRTGRAVKPSLRTRREGRKLPRRPRLRNPAQS